MSGKAAQLPRRGEGAFSLYKFRKTWDVVEVSAEGAQFSERRKEVKKEECLKTCFCRNR